MIEAKPRCKWRGHHIAWCRKYGKFCDAPREYESCPGYEPRLYHETLPFAKVSRNIRVLRNQILPIGTKKSEGVTTVSPEIFPETLRLKPLFDMQDSLIEHKFPHERTMVMDNVISNAGDIYREMTHAYPDSSYVGEKWERLTTWSAKPPLSWLQAGDWVEIRNELQNPSYKALRNQYLRNLQRLREETVKMPMDPKRSVVMTESLDMIKALIPWFESLDPYAPPKWQLDRLTDAIYNYFPREFFKSSWVQIPPEEYLIVYRGLSDKHHEEVMKRGFYPSPSEEKVYTTVSFGEAVRFAYSHVKDEGGNPIVYELRVPLDRFQSQILYYIDSTIGWKRTGFLTSGPLEPALIKEVIPIPADFYEATRLLDRKEREDQMREAETGLALSRIPEEYVKELPAILSGMDILDIHVKHPSYTSMYNISTSSTLDLKNQFGPELKQMISEAETEKREIGAMLCRTAAGQPHLSRACYGRRETVTVADCHDGLSPLGSFHVHLSGTSSFSVPDLKLAIKKEELSCLGYTKNGAPMLRCILPKLYYDYPASQQVEINKMLSQAESYIERAKQVSQTSPHSSEARELSQRALQILSSVEGLLGVNEVPL